MSDHKEHCQDSSNGRGLGCEWNNCGRCQNCGYDFGDPARLTTLPGIGDIAERRQCDVCIFSGACRASSYDGADTVLIRVLAYGINHIGGLVGGVAVPAAPEGENDVD